MKHIYDPAFRYTSSANTDVRKTFARIRREQEKAKEAAKLHIVPVIRTKVVK